jgi:hypothetical protein
MYFVGEIINEYKIDFGKPGGKVEFREPCVYWSGMLKWTFR